MEIRESDERKYSQLDLHELARVVKGFLIDYPFVFAAYLSPGAEQNRPYNLLFEVSSVPEDMAGLHERFVEHLSDGPEHCLVLSRVYKNKDKASIDEWMWYEVSNAENIEGEGLHNFVLPRENVCLFAKQDHSTVTDETEITDADHVSGVQYVFRKSGPGWMMVFNGNSIGPLRQIGYAYFHYCIRNHQKEFTPLELEQAVNGITGLVESEELPVDTEYDEDSKKQFPGYQVGSLKSITPRQNKADYDTIKKTLRRYKELKEEIPEAERTGDPQLEELKEEMEDIMGYLSECTRQGKLKPFTDQTTRVSNKVNRAMARALDELHPYSDEAYNHFKESFGKLYSSKKMYRPIKQVNWILE